MFTSRWALQSCLHQQNKQCIIRNRILYRFRNVKLSNTLKWLQRKQKERKRCSTAVQPQGGYLTKLNELGTQWSSDYILCIPSGLTQLLLQKTRQSTQESNKILVLFSFLSSFWFTFIQQHQLTENGFSFTVRITWPRGTMRQREM